MAESPSSSYRVDGKPVSGRLFWNHQLRMRFGQYVLDFLVLAATFCLAYLLRFEFDLRGEERNLLTQLPYVMLIQFTVLSATGIYTFVWRFISLTEVHAFLYAAFFSALPILLLRLGLPNSWHEWRVPISVLVIDTVLAFGGLLGVRVLRRVIYERFERPRRQTSLPSHLKKPVLLIGAGRTGVQVAREIQQRRDLDLEVLGFVDDDQNISGSVVQGIKILGATRDLPRLVEQLGIDHVILTVAASRSQTRRIVELCESIPIKIRIMPGLSEIIDGRVSVSRIRDVLIDDLLGRDPVLLEADLLRGFLTGKRVMVTGAGGSIGGELARQIAGFGASELILAERSEGALFEIERQIRSLTAHGSSPERQTRVIPWLVDISDPRRVATRFEHSAPQVVFHAAAHKHVPMLEHHPGEAVRNNVLGTRQLAKLAGEFGVEVFVLISTDKAVCPQSVMGASKRLAELVVQNLAPRFTATRFVAVRFGNVLGSTGSVVPIFRQQIAEGGPITVTHPDVTRYFMTIPEAASLVLEAGAIGRGGDILMLDMGGPIKIVDLARDMISLSGLRPDEDIEIVFTGLRPGEKLHEDLMTHREQLSQTRHPKIRVVTGPPQTLDNQTLERLEELARHDDGEKIRHFMIQILPQAELASEDQLAPGPSSAASEPQNHQDANIETHLHTS